MSGEISMVELTVFYLGGFRSLTGTSRESLQMPAGATVAQVIEQLAVRHGEAFAQKVWGSQRKLAPFCKIFLSNKEVPATDLDQPIPSSSQLEFFFAHAVMGGSGREP